MYKDADEWTEDDVADIIANPFHCMVWLPVAWARHAPGDEPTCDEDTWVKANIKFIREYGPEKFLRTLLRAIKGLQPDDESPT